MRELLGMFGIVLTQIEQHDSQFPEHGKNCSCMDTYIRTIRQLTDSDVAQERLDYVIGAVVKNRPVKMVAAQPVRQINRARA
jgi:hypothetical protein